MAFWKFIREFDVVILLATWLEDKYWMGLGGTATRRVYMGEGERRETKHKRKGSQRDTDGGQKVNYR